MSKFQLTVFGIFILFIVAGVIAFATYKGGNKTANQLQPITVWGTFPSETFDDYVNNINQKLAQSMSVTYIYKNPEVFSSDFISALAKGTGPDVILIPSDMILPHLDKLATIPFTALPKGTFQSMFIQEGEMYYSTDGVTGIPFSVDPLVMYWNRDTFSAAGLATYPRNWEDFTELNKKLTSKDENGNIRKSAVALGDFSNINNAREIFASLIFQTGNPITYVAEGGMVQSAMKTSFSNNPIPVVQYFIKFVNPSSPDYSWNRGMTMSKSAFLAGGLATYFGFASEIADIRAKNPNLNFDVAPFPQVKTGGLKSVYAKMYGFSITKSSRNPNSAYQIISILTDPSRIGELSKTMYLPTVSRGVIAQGTTDPYITIFNNAALVSRSWLDISPSVSRQLFGNMIDSVTSGKKNVSESVQDTSDQYDIMLQQVYK